ncbi:MAG: hypothetical protein V8S22_01580 [Lachnospiraceae bacterium]
MSKGKTSETEQEKRFPESFFDTILSEKLIWRKKNGKYVSRSGRALAGNIRCRVKESTYAKYANVVRKHLIPALGNCQDGELTTRQAEEMVRRELGLDLMTEEAAEKISEKTMGDILMVLKEILSYGELLGYHTPCRLELLHLKKKEKKAVVLERQSQIKLEAFLLGEKDPVRTGSVESLYGDPSGGNLRSEAKACLL